MHKYFQIYDLNRPADDSEQLVLRGDPGRGVLHRVRAPGAHVVLPQHHQGQARLSHGLDRDDDPFRVCSLSHDSLHILCSSYQVREVQKH